MSTFSFNANIILNKMADQQTQPPIQTSKDHILYSSEYVLGSSSSGTNVYKGTFGKRPVAVKLLTDVKNCQRAENEIDILVNFDNHPNIVRYIAFEKQPAGFLFALELCHSWTLANWVKDKKCITIKVKKLEVLKQCAEGVAFLHRNGVIHRNLKPSNILFFGNSYPIVVKIADFGISRILDTDRSSRTITSSGGTTGWKAAEVLDAEEKLGDRTNHDVPKLTKRADIFSLGCIFFYVLTKGKHPFGSIPRLYDQNILDDRIEFLTSYKNLRLNCNLTLIETMIARTPSNRPDAEYILAHPIFWSYEKMLNFIVDISNFVNECYFKLKSGPYIPTKLDMAKKICIDNLEQTIFAQNLNRMADGWFSAVDINLKNLLMENSLYKNQYHSVTKLIRLIRNFNNHYHEKTFDQAIKAHVGEIPNFFMKYWLDKFPVLVNEVRCAFVDCKNEAMLQIYYEGFFPCF